MPVRQRLGKQLVLGEHSAALSSVPDLDLPALAASSAETGERSAAATQEASRHRELRSLPAGWGLPAAAHISASSRKSGVRCPVPRRQSHHLASRPDDAELWMKVGFLFHPRTIIPGRVGHWPSYIDVP